MTCQDLRGSVAPESPDWAETRDADMPVSSTEIASPGPRENAIPLPRRVPTAPAMTAERSRAMVDARRANIARLRSDTDHDGLRAFPGCDVAAWEAMARAAGVRLPPWGVPLSTVLVKRYCRLLGISLRDAAEWYLGRPGSVRAIVEAWERHSPTWPAKAFVGDHLLSWLERDGRIVRETEEALDG